MHYSRLVDEDIRWLQRKENFDRAFKSLQKGFSKKPASQLEEAGLIKCYELTFELAWKTLKDYLTFQGHEVRYPRETIKKAFELQLIADGHLWIEMLEDRNELAQTYNEEQVQEALFKIEEKFLPGIVQVHDSLNSLT